MAVTELINRANVTGLIDGELTPVDVEASVILVDGLTVTKTANKTGWSDGPLTYTISILNSTGFAYTDIVVTDLLDPSAVALDTTSVRIGNEPQTRDTDFTYNETTGELSISKTPAISVPDGDSIAITFQVTQS